MTSTLKSTILAVILMGFVMTFAWSNSDTAPRAAGVTSFRVLKQDGYRVQMEVQYDMKFPTDLPVRLWIRCVAAGVDTDFCSAHEFILLPGHRTVETRLVYGGLDAPARLTTDALEFQFFTRHGGIFFRQRLPFQKTWIKKGVGADADQSSFDAYAKTHPTYVMTQIPVKGKGRRPGETMPDFTLPDEDMTDHALHDLIAGKKAVLYYFLGCNADNVKQLGTLSPLLAGLQKDGWAVVGIQYFGSSAICKFSARENHLVGTVVMDTTGQVCNQLGIGGFTVMTVDGRGTIRYRGPIDEKAIRQSINGH